MEPATVAILSAFLVTNASLAITIITQRRKNSKQNPGNRDGYVQERDCHTRHHQVMDDLSELKADIAEIKGRLGGG